MNGFATRVSPQLSVLYAALLFLFSCGLEYILTLNPPDYVETSIANSYFKIRITDSNSENEFRGIELYYRIYGYSDSNLPISFQDYDELITNGFRRLSSISDTVDGVSKPLLKVPVESRGKESIITIDFEEVSIGKVSNGNVFISASPQESGAYDLSIFPTRRGVTDTDGSYKKWDDFKASDPDISSQNFSIDQRAKLLLYALSFGKEDISTVAYSKAVCLFNIEIEIRIE